MSVRYLNNKRHSIDILITSNASITVVGNSAVSNIAIANQTVTGATIRQLISTSPSGNGAYWEISRGANVVCTPDSTTYLDFAGNGLTMNVDPTATLDCKLFRALDNEGTLLIQLHKIYDYPDDSTY